MESQASVVQKVTLYVATTFGGDWRKMFDAYAFKGKVSEDALERMLLMAGVGFAISRPFIANTILGVMDTDGDGCITWDEFQRIAQLPTK